MNTIRRIIAATDFSVAAGRAVGRAALIAKERRAELHLLHAVHPLSLYPGTEFGLGDLSRHDQAIEAGAHTRLEELAVTLRERFGIATHAVTRIGRAHTAITTHARQVEANLVVGEHGENTLLDLLLGSTAARVLRLAGYPVLIVKLQANKHLIARPSPLWISPPGPQRRWRCAARSHRRRASSCCMSTTRPSMNGCDKRAWMRSSLRITANGRWSKRNQGWTA